MKRTWFKDWSIGASGGTNLLLTEIKKDFSRTSMDMNSNPNLTFAFHINKRLPSNLELEFEFEKNIFSGDKTYPNKINWLVYGDRFNNETSHFVSQPVYYKTNTTTWFFNILYNLPGSQDKNGKYRNWHLFAKAGFGLSTIGVEMGYKDPVYYDEARLPNPLYEKGQGIHSFKDLYGSFQIGPGVHYYLSPRISVNAELIFLFVSNDYLDGIQNFEATILPDKQVVLARQEVYALSGQLKFGLSYYFNWYRDKLNINLWGQSTREFENKYYRAEGDKAKEELGE
ncbi:MAG TPA: hypothetical protein PLK12_06760 [Prolixibacteraceae bacterium]|nr:hypothetical protein [Prolixibacteraceae bacterium]